MKIAFGVLLSLSFFFNIWRSCGKRSTRANLTPQPWTHKQHWAEKKATRGKEYSTEETHISNTFMCEADRYEAEARAENGWLCTDYIYLGFSDSFGKISIRYDRELLFRQSGWNQGFPANTDLPFLIAVGVFSFLSSSACTWVTRCKLDISLFSSQYALCMLSLKYRVLFFNGYYSIWTEGKNF